MDFQIGETVEKVKGYAFRGTVLGSFETLAGKTRVVVEMKDSGGLLHIFPPEHLRKA